MVEEVLGRLRRLVAYCRWNQGGAEGDESLASQADACLAMAEGMGKVIAPEDVLLDVGSGLDLELPGMAAVRGMAAAGELSGLFVYSLDRLSRDMPHLQVLLEEFRGFDVEVHVVVGSGGESSDGEMMRVIAGVMAECEKVRLRSRSILGKMAAALQGRMPGGRATGLFGYDYDPVARKRTVNEAEASVVVRCFELVCDGWSLSEICDVLNEEGIRTKAGVPFRPAWLRRLLGKSSLMGIDYYGKTRLEVGPGGKNGG